MQDSLPSLIPHLIPHLVPHLIPHLIPLVIRLVSLVSLVVIGMPPNGIYSGTIIVQAAEICMRWATLSELYADFWDQNLFAISGQILEAAILRSAYVFPLVEANERTPGIKSCYIERLSSVSLAVRQEEREKLTGFGPRRPVVPAQVPTAFTTSAPLSRKSPRPLTPGTLLPSGLGSSPPIGLANPATGNVPLGSSSSTFNFVGIKGQSVIYPSRVLMQALVGVKEGTMGFKKKWCAIVEGNGLNAENLVLFIILIFSNLKSTFHFL